MYRKITLLLLIAAASMGAEAAAPQNKIPSCYAANRMEIPPPVTEREVYVLLDQTVVLDADLKQALLDSVRPVLTPGTAFTIFRFSAFSQGRYLDVVTSGVLEQPIPKKERDSVSVPKLKSFDACMKGQWEYGVRLALTSIAQTMQESSSELARSDVLGSLAETSRIIKAAKTPHRIVVVVSDMLENSSVSSFYANNGIKKLEPEKELKAVDANHLFGDFGGASVYVMGAATIPETASKGTSKKATLGYRDPKTLGALKQFWSAYFSRSNAKLEEFGMPALLSPLQ